jgi:MFS family permease
MTDGASGIHWKFWGGIATAIGMAVGAWLLGVLPTIWSAVIAAAAWTWELIWYSLPLPLIALVILALLALRGIFAMLPKTPAAVESPSPAQLGELEQRMLDVLTRADGDMVYLDRAAEILGVPRLRLQQACDELLTRGLIGANHRSISGSRLFLTPEGRDYVIAQGYPRGHGGG